MESERETLFSTEFHSNQRPLATPRIARSSRVAPTSSREDEIRPREDERRSRKQCHQSEEQEGTRGGDETAEERQVVRGIPRPRVGVHETEVERDTRDRELDRAEDDGGLPLDEHRRHPGGHDGSAADHEERSNLRRAGATDRAGNRRE